MRVGLAEHKKIGLLALAEEQFLSYTKGMQVWKMVGLLCCLCGLAEPVVWAQASYRTPFSCRLEQQISFYNKGTGSPGMDRLRVMSFYYPDNSVRKIPGFWQTLFSGKKITQQQEEALAFYLFNMYISTAAYREDVPARLTLDYLGVLDGFSKCQEMLPLSQWTAFYEGHRAAIKERISSYFKQANQANYEVSSLFNDKRERAFLRLLSSAPARGRYPGYVWTGDTRLAAQARPEDTARIAGLIRQSLTAGENKVITFSKPSMQWENLDNPLSIAKHSVTRLYRCVNDECAYCSYLLGKEFCEGINTAYANWGISRLYKITAYPATEEFLTPARGKRFILADGGQASPWYYHTAVLVILQANGHFTPLVADTFLAGEEPVLLEDWLKHFKPKETYFQVDVFERKQAIENAIVEPALRQGERIMVDGKTYVPYDVLP